jgi:hypothetical protein
VIWTVFSAALLVWILFFRGAEHLEGSWLTAWLHVPGMTATEIRVWAVVSAIAMAVVGVVRWNA